MTAPRLLCLDLGNTHLHHGLVAPGGLTPATATGEIPTARLDDPREGLPAWLARLQAAAIPLAGIAWCSVVPAANPRLLATLAGLPAPVWRIGPEADLGLPIAYPRPQEIGHDRLANAAGAVALVGTPAIVIDLGTAVTFDILTRAGGYEGGIIAPGPALMTRYLHERTAQLPWVEDVLTPVTTAIGRSTVEALRIGAVLGFTGLLQTLLDAVLAELAGRGETAPALLTAGGAHALAAGRLRQPTRDVPDLTLRGLAAAWARAQT